MMRESIEIDAPPDQVWRVIEDPKLMTRWNPKITGVDPVSFGARGVGHKYRIAYQMGNRRSDFLAEIEEFRESERLAIRLTEGNLPTGKVIRESYVLSKTTTGTLLVQLIDLKKSGINPFARFLMTILHRIGKPTGKRYLETLKEIVERGF